MFCYVVVNCEGISRDVRMNAVPCDEKIIKRLKFPDYKNESFQTTFFYRRDKKYLKIPFIFKKRYTVSLNGVVFYNHHGFLVIPWYIIEQDYIWIELHLRARTPYTTL